MSVTHRKILSMSLVGVILGAALALTAPPARLQAEQACRCDDDGHGEWKCNGAQTQCIAGSEICNLHCA